MQNIWTAWRLTLKIFASHRKLWLPFLATACVEVLFLGLIWLAPQAPFSSVLAPPLRYFFGDNVLHYPAHLWFLYHAMKHTNLAASILVGAFMGGVACAMVRQIHRGEPLLLRSALAARSVPYVRLVILWIAVWGLAKGVLEAAAHVAPKTPGMFWILVGLTALLQVMLVYSIPAAVFEGIAWWKALLRGLRESARYPLSTLVIVAVPASMILFFSYFCHPGRLVQWMDRTIPELTVALVVARLIVWTVADALMTVGIAHLWLVHRAPAAAGVPVVSSPAVRRAANPTSERSRNPVVVGGGATEVHHVENPVVA